MSEVYSHSQSSGIDKHYICSVGDFGNCWYKLPNTSGGKFNLKTVAIKDRRGRPVGYSYEVIIEDKLITVSGKTIQKLLIPSVALNHLLVLNNGKIFDTTSFGTTKPAPSYLGWTGKLECKGDMSGDRGLTILSSVSGVPLSSIDATHGYVASMPALGTRAIPDLNYLAFLDTEPDTVVSGGVYDARYNHDVNSPLTFGTGSTGTSIVLNSTASAADDYYNGYILTWNGVSRNITDYTGSTKTAIIDSAFTVDPVITDQYTAGTFTTLKNFGECVLTAEGLVAKETDYWKRSICKNVKFELTFNRLQSTTTEIAELTSILNGVNDWEVTLADNTKLYLMDALGVTGDVVNEGDADGLEVIKHVVDGIIQGSLWSGFIIPV